MLIKAKVAWDCGKELVGTACIKQVFNNSSQLFELEGNRHNARVSIKKVQCENRGRFG